MKKKLVLLILITSLVFSCYKTGRIYFLAFEKEYYKVYIGDDIKFKLIKIVPQGKNSSLKFQSYNQEIHSEIENDTYSIALKEGNAKIIASIDNEVQASTVLQIRDTIVKFKDQKFKNYLLANYKYLDKNKDGEFHRSELVDNSVLSISGDSITYIDEVKHFKKLFSLTLKNTKIKKIELGNLPELEILTLQAETIIDSLNIKDCKKFKEINKYIYDNAIVKHISISGDNYVRKLKLSNIGIQTLNISDCKRLEELYCNGNNIKNLDVSSSEELTNLDCSDNSISFLNLSNNENLRYLYTKGNPKLSKICIKDKDNLNIISADFFTKITSCD